VYLVNDIFSIAFPPLGPLCAPRPPFHVYSGFKIAEQDRAILQNKFHAFSYNLYYIPEYLSILFLFLPFVSFLIREKHWAGVFQHHQVGNNDK